MDKTRVSCRGSVAVHVRTTCPQGLTRQQEFTGDDGMRDRERERDTQINSAGTVSSVPRGAAVAVTRRHDTAGGGGRQKMFSTAGEDKAADRGRAQHGSTHASIQSSTRASTPCARAATAIPGAARSFDATRDRMRPRKTKSHRSCGGGAAGWLQLAANAPMITTRAPHMPR